MKSQREPVEEEPAETASSWQKRWWQPLVPLMPLFGFLMVLFLIGWPHSSAIEQILILGTRLVAFLYGLLFLVSFYKRPLDDEMSRLQRYSIPAVAVLIILSALFENPLSVWIHDEFPHLPVRLILLFVAAVQQVSLILINLPSWIPTLESSLLRRLNPGTILFGTFALLVVFGTLLLKMPNATTGGLSWIDVLLTSTSAVCVTGLIVVDKDERVNTLKDKVAHAVIADAEDPKVLEQLGLPDFDRVCVTIGEDFGASLVVTGNLQEQGVEHLSSGCQTPTCFSPRATNSSSSAPNRP